MRKYEFGIWVAGAEPIEEQTYKVGDIFERYGSYYMIVQPLDDHVCLVNAVTGNRWQDKMIQVHDSYRIKQDELANAIDDWHKFKHEPQLTVTVGEINK